jgi:hypothetical protein
LDADATLIEGEKRDAQWSDQGGRGDLPRQGFLFETPVCLVDECREGNISPGAGQRAFYRACKARMPKEKRMARYRADSASYQAELINALEADYVRWAITADQDVAVKAVIATLSPADWQEPGARVWVSGGGRGAHHEPDEGGVSPDPQAEGAATAGSV